MDCLLTRFFVPTWWVRAYERQLAAPAHAPIDPAQSVILPSLTEVELDALSILINQCQQQMLTGRTPLALSQKWHDKHMASPKKADQFAFKRMFTLFGGIRLLVADREDKAQATALFGQELWRQKDGDSVVQLDMTDLGKMLILGYGEPYLCRLSRSTAAALDTLLEGKNGPLSLWRAPWLDFKGLEKLVLLRMERAMQWQLSYLNLSGVFEGSFDELTAGIVAERTLARADNPLELKFAALEKIGKKLADHGYLDWEWEQEFLAFSQEGIGQSLVWKIMDSKGQQEDLRAYRTSSAAYLFEHGFLRHLDSILLSLLGIRWRDDSAYQELRAKIDALLDGPIAEEVEVLTVLGGNRLLVDGALFIEWLVRLVPGSSTPLPEDVIGEPIMAVLRSVTQQNITEAFREFAELIADEPGIIEALRSDGRMSVAVEPARQSARANAQAHPGASSPKPLVQKPLAQKPTGKKPTAHQGQKPQDQQPEQAAEPLQDISQPSSSPPPSAVPRRHSGTHKDLSTMARLKTDAAHYLHELKAADPRGYQDLKKRYIASLQSHEAKAILDMQKILTTQHFDTQIRQSLVMFLVRHPAQWQAGARNTTSPMRSDEDKQRSAEAILKSLLS